MFFYLINVSIVLLNLYFAITTGAWFSWLVVGYVAGLITAKIIYDIVNR